MPLHNRDSSIYELRMFNRNHLAQGNHLVQGQQPLHYIPAKITKSSQSRSWPFLLGSVSLPSLPNKSKRYSLLTYISGSPSMF